MCEDRESSSYVSIEKREARGALVDCNDPNIPVIRPSIRTDTDIVFYLTQPAASVNAVDFRDLAFGSVIRLPPMTRTLF